MAYDKSALFRGVCSDLIPGFSIAIVLLMFPLSIFMCVIAGQFIYMCNEFGWMPPESVAISFRDDALKFAQEVPEDSPWTEIDSEMEKLSEAIKQYHPKGFDIENGCVKILFSIDISNDFGYVYCPQGVLPPDDWIKNCKKVAEGVYLYEYLG